MTTIQYSDYPGKPVQGVPYDGLFPSQNVSPEKKAEKKYGFAWAQAMYQNRDLRRPWWISIISEWIENRTYMQGIQDVSKYQKFFGITPEDRSTYMNVDWTPVAIFPKFMEIITSIIAKRATRLVVNSLDPMAEGEKNKIINKIKADIVLRPVMQEIEQEFGVKAMEDPQPGMPQTMEELELYIQSGSIRLAEEMAAEMGIALCLQDSKWDDVQLFCLIEDFIATGMGVTRDFMDTTGRLVTERVLPERCILDYTESWNFQDARYGGMFLRIGAADLKIMSKGELTDSQIKEVTQASRQVADNFFWSPYFVTYVNQFDERASILHFWFKTTETVTYENTKTRYGTEIAKKRDYGFEPKNGKKKITIDIPVYYEGYWCIGTPYVFGYRKIANQGRDSFYRTHPPMKVFMHRNFYGMNKPVASRIKTWIDDFQINWLQYQNARAKEPPPGIQVNVDSFAEEVVKQAGSGQVDIIKVLTQTGWFPYKGTDSVTGEPITMYPVQATNVNFSPYFQSRIMGMQLAVDQIRQVLGFNELTDASTPNPKTLVGVADISALSTDNSIWPLAHSIGELKKMTGESLLCRLRGYTWQDAQGEYNAYTGYLKNSIGEAPRFLSLGPELSTYDVGVEIEEVMSDVEEQKLEQDIQTQLAQRITSGHGGIELEDAFMIRRMKKNLKLAEQLLIYRKNMRAKQDQARNIEVMQAQSKAQAEAAMMVEQAKAQSIQAELEKVKLEGDEKRKTLVVEYYLKAQLEGKLIEMNAIRDAVLQIDQLDAAPLPPAMQQGMPGEMPQGIPQNMQMPPGMQA